MTITMPSTPNFRSSKFGLETNTQRFESPLTKSVQRLVLAGSRWGITATLPRMNRSQAAAWQAFFLKCEGSANNFYGFDPDAKNPRGAATGTPLVKGGSQTGGTLIIDGCPANATGWMKAGDYFSWANGELKMLTQDANTNGSGETTLAFKPNIRTSPADNTPLIVRNTSCTMVLSDDMQAIWQVDHNGIFDEISFSAFEVFS
ncbi:hypothetical protein BH10PLA2_BH10PLA2_00710 [soil metagenome]